MKTALAALSLLILSCCSLAPAADIPAKTNTDGTMTLTLTKEQAAYCVANGGCIVVPIAIVTEVVQRARLSCGKEI